MSGKNIWRRRLLYGACGFLIVLLFILASREDPVAVDVSHARRGTLASYVSEEGITRVREKYEISAPLSGRLLRIPLNVGDPVKAGETVLARILPSDPAFLDARTEAELRAALSTSEASLALALADVERAKAEQDFASSELERAEALFERGTIAAAGLDQKRMAHNRSVAVLHTAEAAVSVARSNVERSKAALIEPGSDMCEPASCVVEVLSPANGKILRIAQKSEGTVAGGTLLLEVGDSRDLEIVADLLSTQAVQVRESAPVLIDGWGGGTLRGRVRRIEPFGFTKISALGVEEQRVNVIIDLVDETEKWQPLGHGYRVDVHIETWKGDDVMSIPANALFRTEAGWSVFTVANDSAVRRAVEVGHFGEDRAEIISGLEPGEPVIEHPGRSINNGTRLRLRNTETVNP